MTRTPAQSLAARKISQPYLLVVGIALCRHRGELWADRLWHKDLYAHLDTIEHLTLACPVRNAEPPAGWGLCDQSQLTVVPLPAMGQLAWFKIPRLALLLNRAIQTAEIVHSGVAGWPFPLGWIAFPLARRSKKFLVVVVESSFWRVNEATVSALNFWKSRIFERINIWCIAICDMSFFTSNRYLVELSSVKSAHAYVLPASWLDDRQLIDPSLIPGKFAGGQKCRLLFAGRLTEAKGVLVLVDAIERSDVRIDIIGEGELGALCRDLAARFSDRVRVLSPVPYGDPFSTLMDGYHAIVVPTLSDEQPRILFDAYARGLPVIASDRGGHLDLVRPGETGFLVPAGDSQALAEAMDTITRNPSHLQSMAMAARQFVQHRTHAAMHRDRADLISKAILENKPKVSCSTAA